MACTPKFMRRKLKLVKLVAHYGKKLGYTVSEPIIVDGKLTVTFRRKED